MHFGANKKYFRDIYFGVTRKWSKNHGKNSISSKILIRRVILQIIMMLVLMNMVLNVEDFWKTKVGLIK